MELKGFIKIDRNILQWQWFKDRNTFMVWMWILLNANFRQNRFMGEELQPGEVATSINSIATGTNLTVMQVRTALKHLKITGEITCRKRSKYQVITVINWEKYQMVSGNITGKQQADNRQITGKQQADNNNVRSKEGKKEKNVCVPHPTLPDCVAFFDEHGRSQEDAQRFFSYNNARGWKMGGQSVEDWNSAADMWINQKPDSKSTGTASDDGLDDFGKPKKERFQ